MKDLIIQSRSGVLTIRYCCINKQMLCIFAVAVVVVVVVVAHKGNTTFI